MERDTAVVTVCLCVIQSHTIDGAVSNSKTDDTPKVGCEMGRRWSGGNKSKRKERDEE